MTHDCNNTNIMKHLTYEKSYSYMNSLTVTMVDEEISKIYTLRKLPFLEDNHLWIVGQLCV